MMKIEKRNDLKSSKLFLAVEMQNICAVRDAIASGEAVDVLDRDGNTPLIRGSFLGSADIVTVLIAHKSNVNAQNDIGYSSLHFAAQEGHEAVAKLLVKAGAAIDLQDKHGNTPLSNAVYSENQELIMLLCNAGASLDILNNHGVSPRSLAVSMGVKL